MSGIKVINQETETHTTVVTQPIKLKHKTNRNAVTISMSDFKKKRF